MVMDPIRPSSDAWIEEFICNTTLVDGLRFDSKTGEIAGTPHFNYSSSMKTVIISARNSLGMVSTKLSLYFYRHFTGKEGVSLCILPVSSFPVLIPDLFDTTMDRSCSIQPTLSWSSTAENPNPLLRSSPHSFLRFAGYINFMYHTPTTFILSTISPVIVLLDDYATPLLQTESTKSFTDYRVTIQLTGSYHRIVVYTMSTSNAAFTLYYAFHAYSFPETLITSDVISLLPQPPRYLSTPHVVGFTHQPLDVYFHSWYPVTSTIQIGGSSDLVMADNTHLRMNDPLEGSSTVSLQVASDGGYSFLSVPIWIEQPRPGFMISVIENEIKQQKLVDSLSDFSIE